MIRIALYLRRAISSFVLIFPVFSKDSAPWYSYFPHHLLRDFFGISVSFDTRLRFLVFLPRVAPQPHSPYVAFWSHATPDC